MVWRSCSLLIVLTASLAVACGDDEATGTGLSGGASATAGSSSSSGGGEGSSSSSTGHGSSSSDGSSSSTTATTDVSTSADSSNTTGSTTDNTTGTTADPADCNNGVLDPGEQCDGQNIGDFTCEGLGYAGGTLSCDPVMCILDTSMCEMGDSTGSTGG